MNSNEKRLAYELLRKRLFEKTDGHCWYCGCIPTGANEATIDHVTPRIRGGSEDETNLVAACGRCNGSKGDRSLIEYREWVAQRRAGWPKFKPDQMEWLLKNVTMPALAAVMFFGEAAECDRGNVAWTMKKFWDSRYLRSSSIPPTVAFDRLRSYAQS